MSLAVLADLLDAAAADHLREYPHGDWKGVNDRLGDLRRQASRLCPEMNCMVLGNAAAARYLRSRA